MIIFKVFFFTQTLSFIVLYVIYVLPVNSIENIFLNIHKNVGFSNSAKEYMLKQIKEMFYFGYDNYMKHAYPEDELNPIFCKGRGPDYKNPLLLNIRGCFKRKDNININDVLGDYQLTLIDTLDTLAIIGNGSEFKRAVQMVIDHLSFEKETTVQVFEATIRVLGSLVSTHLLITDPKKPFGDLRPAGYDDQLLTLAHDLAGRLLRAFESSATGLPHPRVNLKSGVPPRGYLDPRLPTNDTCLAGAGSLLLEFSALSRLLGDPVYEAAAKRAVKVLWGFRSNVTGLLGNIINIQTGQWSGQMSGLGAGLDSFYEYLLKGYVSLGDEELLSMFQESQESVRYYMKRGRISCTKGHGLTPFYVNVNMRTGEMSNNWIDALQAAWPGVLILNGQVDEAICQHAVHYAIWKKYGVLPERFNWLYKQPEVKFYPLRPELIESTYLLYQATKNPFYLHVGREIFESLQNHTKAKCGHATVHDVTEMSLEDRMESFFLSETCKYLYLLFDEKNPVNVRSEDYLFTTEGHLLPIRRLRNLAGNMFHSRNKKTSFIKPRSTSCEKMPPGSEFGPPLEDRYLQQIFAMIGVNER